MLTQKDMAQIEARGSSADSVREQVERFKKGFPWLKIVAPATPERGIMALDEEQADAAVKYFETAEVRGKCKFVPASGAASRMFKDLFSGLDALQSGKTLSPDSPAMKFASGIERFAFYDESLFGKPSGDAGYVKGVLEKTLTSAGLDYGSKPKGVIKFHKYPDGEIRTAFAEHLVEAQDYMRDSDGRANLVVTISPEHRPLFEAALACVKAAYEEKYGVKYNVEFTCQDKSTDTVAVDMENRPFRTDDGSLLFRPAGHGALIHNLNMITQELVSIKNIDNVSNERFLGVTSRYKKVLMGKALELRDKIHGFLHELDAVTGRNLKQYKPYPYLPGYNAIGYDEAYKSENCQMLCNDIEEFLRDELCITMPYAGDCKTRVLNLIKKLNRPIRVCGMVRNQGEPGGGPFIISEKDGSTSLQILESVQINMDDAASREALARATHFNPVDIVCCLHDYEGNSFNLLDFQDDEAGFISSKSYQGRELKALELPGLWNGAMSDWNTCFVEVPQETFNPVKVVLDLLRPAHQSE